MAKGKMIFGDKNANSGDFSLSGTGVKYNGKQSADTITGSAYDDELAGGGGNDVIGGGNGNDTLAGGNGDDTLTGGEGADVFRLGADFAENGTDTITDYQAGDLIDLSAALDLALNFDTLVTDTDIEPDGILDVGDGILDAFDPSLYDISEYLSLDAQGQLTLAGSSDVLAVVKNADAPASQVSISIDGYTFTLDAVFPPAEEAPAA